MKLLPEQVIIASDKIISYLLVPREKNDKSKFLFLLGYTAENWKELELDIKSIVLNNDIILEKTSEFGNLYSVKGNLKSKTVITIWLREIRKDIYRFITLYPDYEQKV